MKFNIIKDFVSVDYDEKVSKILHNIKTGTREVLVFKKGVFKGVVTKKNILRVGVSFPEEKIGKICVMPPNISPNTDIVEIANLFISSGLPKLVVFDNKKVLGVISRIDFLKNIVANKIGKLKVDEVKTKDVITIRPKDNLAKAVALYKEKGISKLVVFDVKVQGVITLKNILDYFYNVGKISVDNLRNTLVKDVMRKEVYSILETDSINKAILKFSSKNISSLVVFEKTLLQKKLSGIITKTDILSKFVHRHKKTSLNINIASKVKNLDEAMVVRKLSKLEKMLKKGTNVFVYFKQGKEKYRGLPLINCRLRLVSSGKSENMSVEGWGVEHSLELAITKIKRKISDDFF